MTRALALSAAAVVLAACSTLDCPMNSRVAAKYKLAGAVATLTDTFTVSTTRTGGDGNDTILVNRLTATDSLSLPMSYSLAADTLYFTLTQEGSGIATTDTVRVEKTNMPHFEAVDCTPSMFHEITGIGYTRHNIDSIKVNYNKVTNNDAKAHFLIYFKNSSR